MKKQPRANISDLNDLLFEQFLKLQNFNLQPPSFISKLFTNKYFRLMRLDKPVGYFLLALPCLWTLVFASKSYIKILSYSLLFLLGAILMRSAGCIINDIIDRNLDKQVERTKNRPLASGEVSLFEAIVLLFFLLSFASIILIALPTPAIYLGIFSLIPIAIYPVLKRYTFLVQVFLGLVFNLGVFIAWYSISSKSSYVPLLIYIGSALWTIGYDTIYAFQDKNDDKEAGIKSLALKLDRDAPTVIWMMYQIFALILFIVGLNTHMNWCFYVIIGLAVYHLYWQTETLNIDDPQDCSKKFKSNVLFGMLVLIAVWVGRLKF